MIVIVEQNEKNLEKKLDPTLIGFSEKKKKIKPGYKKKINWAIEDSNKKNVKLNVVKRSFC